ncbi:phosphoserine phosphatase SerB, partial [Microbacterium sp. AGC62]
MTAARFLVVLDADSTLIRNEVIELLADEAGRRAEVQAATEAAMRGEVDFSTSLRSRVAALQGVPVSAFERVRARIEPTPGVRDLTAAVHDRGGVVGVVSGGFHEILDHIAPGLGVDRWRANRLEIADGELAGRVDGDIVDGA